MSNYRGHLYGGTVTFLLVLGVVTLGFFIPSAVEVLSLFAICLFASLLPDIDTKSVGQKLFYRLLFAADALLILARYYREAAFLGLVAMLPLLGKHRGWTHTVWAAFLVPLPFFLFPLLFYQQPPQAPLISPTLVQEGLPYYVAAVAGYLSHLLLDRKYF